MRVKDPSKIANWDFLIINPEGEEVMIPPEGSVKLANLPALVSMVLSYIRAYDNATNNEYSKQQRALAVQNGSSTFEGYMSKVIEHQFCLRKKGQGIECWNDGVGDVIHNTLSAVDGYIAKTPESIKRVVQRAIESITPSKSKTFGGCSSCGGSKVFSPSKDNLGRAGKLNKL